MDLCNLTRLAGLLRGWCLDLLQSDMPSWLAQGSVVGSLQSDMPSWLAQRSAVGHLVFEEREDIVCRDQRSIVWKNFYLSGRGGDTVWRWDRGG